MDDTSNDNDEIEFLSEDIVHHVKELLRYHVPEGARTVKKEEVL